jgi:2,3-bisphosphoglycerate-independent phosphoglycerate mutase
MDGIQTQEKSLSGRPGESMTRRLLIFMDGVGLGLDDAQINPFVRADMPVLRSLLEGQPLAAGTAPFLGSSSTLLALDACLGVPGLPQSATGQATLLTGQNIPGNIGYHYGPKPDKTVAKHLKNGNLFNSLKSRGLRAALLNAYPPRYFEAIASGRRIYSAIPLAVTSAGLPLKTDLDLNAGLALAADFTAQGWRDHLGLVDTPVLPAHKAGEQLANLASQYHFSMFEYWLSDYAGHRQDMNQAVLLLEEFDQVLSGLLNVWESTSDLILITSDHGNLEDVSTRRHTLHSVPALLVGPTNIRKRFAENLSTIAGIAPSILDVVSTNND